MSGGLWGPCADVCHAACPTRRWCSRPGRLAARGTARSLHLAHIASRPVQRRARQRVHQANMSGGLWGPCADVCHAACPTRRWCSRPGRLAARGTARSLHLAHIASRPVQSARASACTRQTCQEVCGARALTCAMQHAPRVAGAAGQVAWQQEALRARCNLLTWPPGRCRARARARAPGTHAGRSVGHERCRVPCSMPHASPEQPARSPGSKRHCALAASCSHRLPAGAERARQRVHQANMSGGLWGPCADVCHAACPTRRWCSRPGRLAARGTARSLQLAHMAPRPLQSARASARTRHTCGEVCGALAASMRAQHSPLPCSGASSGQSACPCASMCHAACPTQHAPHVAGAAGQVAWQQGPLRARCILLTWPPGRCRARARARAPGTHAGRSVGHVR